MIAILHWLNSDTDSGFSQNFKTELAYQSARFPNDFINSISFGFQLLNVNFFSLKLKKLFMIGRQITFAILYISIIKIWIFLC